MKAELPEALAMERPVVINPLQYPGWDSLLAGHAGSCFFQGTAWARVLHETYGHRPFYFCSFANGNLVGLLPVMEIRSPLTGRMRAVSLPFTDVCPPLHRGTKSAALYEAAMEYGLTKKWQFLECRSNNPDWPGSIPSLSFFGHVIDLHSKPDLFKSFEASVQRAIRKAEKSALQVEFSTTLESMETFFTLHCKTRHRHGVPPQPFRFFKNIAKHVLTCEQGFIAIVRLERRAIAAAVFFHNQHEAIYKFGASDEEFQSFRPNQFMMWKAIQRLANMGCKRLHLGRTSASNKGLRRFKLGFGASEETLRYFKYSFTKQRFVTEKDRAESPVKPFFSLLPMPLFRMAGRVLYPHLA